MAFNSFSISKVDLRALAPATFTTFSINASDSVLNVSISALIFTTKSFMIIFVIISRQKLRLVQTSKKILLKIFGFILCTYI